MKKEKNTLNEYDKEMNEKYSTLCSIKPILMAKVSKVISRQNIIDFFVDQVLKAQAQERFEDAKLELSDLIIKYNTARNQIKQYYRENKANFTQDWANVENYVKSFDLIEIAYKEFFKRA